MSGHEASSSMEPAAKAMSVSDPTPNHERCGRPSQTGTCQQYAGAGTPHLGYGPCRWHGGALPNVIKHWQVSMAQEECTRLGVPVEVDPNEALLGALYEAEGHAMWLRGKVEELLDDDPETAGTSPELYGKIVSASKDGNYATGRAEPHVLWVMWTQERDRAAQLAAACIKAGIAERQVRIAEQQADMLVSVIKAVLDDPTVKLEPSQRAAADEAVIRHLKAVV